MENLSIEIESPPQKAATTKQEALHRILSGNVLRRILRSFVQLRRTQDDKRVWVSAGDG
jgi:hypothetical protein